MFKKSELSIRDMHVFQKQCEIWPRLGLLLITNRKRFQLVPKINDLGWSWTAICTATPYTGGHHRTVRDLAAAARAAARHVGISWFGRGRHTSSCWHCAVITALHPLSLQRLASQHYSEANAAYPTLIGTDHSPVHEACTTAVPSDRNERNCRLLSLHAPLPSFTWAHCSLVFWRVLCYLLWGWIIVDWTTESDTIQRYARGTGRGQSSCGL